MPRREDAVVKITARGLRGQKRMTDINQKFIRILVQEMITEVGEATVDTLQAYAPERTGRLKRGIKITGQNRSVTRPNIRVGIEGVVSEGGFPYVDATRFGRRAVQAKTGFGSAQPARSASPPGGRGRQIRPFRAPALKLEVEGGRIIYRHRVRAYRPGRDWVRASQDDIRATSDYAFRKVTKAIEKVLTSGSVSEAQASSVTIKSRTGRFNP